MRAVIFAVISMSGLVDAAFCADAAPDHCIIRSEGALRIGYALINVFDHYIDYAQYLTPVWIHVCGRQLRIAYDTPVQCRGENLPAPESSSDYFTIDVVSHEDPRKMGVRIGDRYFVHDPSSVQPGGRISIDEAARVCIGKITHYKGRASWREPPTLRRRRPDGDSATCEVSDHRARAIGKALSAYLWRHLEAPDSIPVEGVNFCNNRIFVRYDTSGYVGAFDRSTLVLIGGSKNAVRLIIRDQGYSVDDVPGQFALRKRPGQP